MAPKRANGLPFPVRMIPLGELTPAPYNPRRISEHDMAALRRSMREFGVVDPLVVRGQDMMVIGGHQRLDAARAEGIDAVPCVVVEDIDDDQAKLLNLALNRISGEWDDAKLSTLLVELEAGAVDLDLSGFDGGELDAIVRGFDVEPGCDGEIPDGEQGDMRGMSFNVTAAQVDIVTVALELSKAAGPFNGTGNANANGNALARIAEAYSADRS
tara:strand:+ start:26 stop:667 length:642 start_codon:yes stop_codon:yes gene_type:complete